MIHAPDLDALLERLWDLADDPFPEGPGGYIHGQGVCTEATSALADRIGSEAFASIEPWVLGSVGRSKAEYALGNAWIQGFILGLMAAERRDSASEASVA